MEWKQKPYNIEKKKEYLDKGYSEIISHLLSQRNLTDLDFYLKSTYNDLPHPHTLNDVEKGVDIFCKSVIEKKDVAIIGDYDCDGILSTLMLKTLCNSLKIKNNFFLPSRINHGYGLNEKTIFDFKKKFKKPPYLLFVVDCGSNNEKEIIDLKKWGIEKIIIIDHHIIDENKKSVSADAFISWHLSNFEETCASGEVFQFIRGMRLKTKKVNPIEYITYAAIGIIGDSSPVYKFNRIVIKYGLTNEAMNHMVSSGLITLIRKSIYNSDISQQDIQFQIVPKINASGRIKEPDLSLNLLLQNNQAIAEKMVDQISELNNERKKIQKSIEMDAVLKINSSLEKYKYGIALYEPNWHIGLIGIVASHITSIFGKPTIIIGNQNGVIKGSARSIKNVDLKTIMKDMRELFLNYGGHSMAAGITFKNSNIDEINSKFNEACKNYYEKVYSPNNYKEYDFELIESELTIENMKTISKMFYPYCYQINPEPIFKFTDVVIKDVSLNEGENWKLLKFGISKNGVDVKFKFKSFSSQYGTELTGKHVDLYFVLPSVILNNRIEISLEDIVVKKQEHK